MNFNMEGQVKIYAKDKTGRIITPVKKLNTITYGARNILAYMFLQGFNNSTGTLRISPKMITLANGDSSSPADSREDTGDTINGVNWAGALGGGLAKINLHESTQDVGGTDIINSVTVTPSATSGSGVDSDFAEVNMTITIPPDALDISGTATESQLKQIIVWSEDPDHVPTDTPYDNPRVLSVATLPTPIDIQAGVYYVIIYTYKIR